MRSQLRLVHKRPCQDPPQEGKPLCLQQLPERPGLKIPVSFDFIPNPREEQVSCIHPSVYDAIADVPEDGSQQPLLFVT